MGHSFGDVDDAWVETATRSLGGCKSSNYVYIAPMHMSSHQVALILTLVLGVLGSDAVIDGT